jgi:small subunit ribosomal protein S8
MVMTDPIADFLTRIRNANTVYQDRVEIPAFPRPAPTLP